MEQERVSWPRPPPHAHAYPSPRWLPRRSSAGRSLESDTRWPAGPGVLWSAAGRGCSPGSPWWQVRGCREHGARQCPPWRLPQRQQLWAAGVGTVPDPHGFCGRWQGPGLTHPPGTHRQPLVPRRGVLGPWPQPAGRADAGLEVGPGSSVSRAAGQSRKESGVSRASPRGAGQAGQPGPEQGPGSQSRELDTLGLVAGGTGEVMGGVVPFLQFGKLRHGRRSYSKFATLGVAMMGPEACLPAFIHPVSTY